MGCRPSSLSAHGEDGPSPSSPAPPAPTTTSHRPPPSSASAPAPSTRPNKPLVLLSSPPANPFPHATTTARLRHERAAFFDTRVTGSRELWAAVNAICAALREGRRSEAQSFADACGLTCPTGRVWADESEGQREGRRARLGETGLFDELGRRYLVPAWVVGEPEGLVGDEPGEEEEEGNGDGGKDEEEEGRSEKTAGLEELDPKGKGKKTAASEEVGEPIWVRARLSSTGTDLQVRVGTTEHVGTMAERIREQLRRANDGVREVRLMYLGRRLEGNKTLEEQGWQRGHVVNAMVVGGDG